MMSMDLLSSLAKFLLIQKAEGFRFIEGFYVCLSFPLLPKISATWTVVSFQKLCVLTFAICTYLHNQ